MYSIQYVILGQHNFSSSFRKERNQSCVADSGFTKAGSDLSVSADVRSCLKRFWQYPLGKVGGGQEKTKRYKGNFKNYILKCLLMSNSAKSTVIYFQISCLEGLVDASQWLFAADHIMRSSEHSVSNRNPLETPCVNPRSSQQRCMWPFIPSGCKSYHPKPALCRDQTRSLFGLARAVLTADPLTSRTTLGAMNNKHSQKSDLAAPLLAGETGYFRVKQQGKKGQTLTFIILM